MEASKKQKETPNQSKKLQPHKKPRIIPPPILFLKYLIEDH